MLSKSPVKINEHSGTTENNQIPIPKVSICKVNTHRYNANTARYNAEYQRVRIIRVFFSASENLRINNAVRIAPHAYINQPE